jgi:endonuclease-3
MAGESRAMQVYREMQEHLGDLGRPSPLKGGRAAFPVLVSTLVSLRTRDAVTERVSSKLLDRAPDPGSMLELGEGELEDLLKPAGFFRQKARQLRGICSAVLERFGGEVPDTVEELLTLPGVGRKTANYVVGMVFGKPAVCVDVHVHRVSNRTGLVTTRTPEETERALMLLYPRDVWNRINHLFVRFGQRVCRPVAPLCGRCPSSGWCPSGGGGGRRTRTGARR